nr:immunoglobulin light chain junction region [Macaca mulatta]MOW67359.1 immunoglobulin light chain junction region [Macaca mulatta]MOW67537.1 immunoglobulin light chain junction region [Macaca mulatta]MOW67705.1 immunoglobulin light chain junction region [Macaca mulatta]MOW67722.1 immunoglobulin light chain junction region [Macaca mulatta]
DYYCGAWDGGLNVYVF